MLRRQYHPEGYRSMVQNTSKSDNPLLDFSGLPHFNAIRPEHVEPALDTLLAHNRAELERLLGAMATIRTLIGKETAP